VSKSVHFDLLSPPDTTSPSHYTQHALYSYTYIQQDYLLITSQGNGHRLKYLITTRDPLLFVPLAEALKARRVHETRWNYAIAKHAEHVVDKHQRRLERFERERFPVLAHDGHLNSYGIRGWSLDRMRTRDIPCLCNPLSAI